VAYYYIRFIKIMYFKKVNGWSNQIIINKENSLININIVICLLNNSKWVGHIKKTITYKVE
jgi:NADH:ubiquinone oxidoreductase subunit 2 (subunit N)